jgi:RHS repeat-associated protein
MFDPTIGRWTTQDPLGFDAGDDNLYRYDGLNCIGRHRQR